MALSFSFPIGKAKKRDSFSSSNDTRSTAVVRGDLSEGVDSESPQYLSEKSNNKQIKGPKSWKSFPSLSFFRDSHSIPSSNNSNSPSSAEPTSVSSSKSSKIPSPCVGKPINTGSRLPVRATSTLTASNKSVTSTRSSIPAVSNTATNPSPKAEGSILHFQEVSNQTESPTKPGNKLSSGKSLPDVTDTESPKPLSAYPSDKPCDLLAQLQLSVDQSSTSEPSEPSLSKPSFTKDNNGKDQRMERDFVNRVSSFDDNGNPYVPHHNPPQAPPPPQHPEEVDIPEVDEESREIKAQKGSGGAELKESPELLETIDFQVGESCSSQEKVKSPLLEDHDLVCSESKGCAEAAPSDEMHSATLSSNISTSSTSRELNVDDINTKESEEDDDDEPKYFINAAALSEDDTFVLPPSPAPSPCNFEKSFLKMISPPKESQPKGRSSSSSDDPEIETQVTPTQREHHQDSITSGPSVAIRPRVPVSKSYPDIVQTTLSNDDTDNDVLKRGMTKENSDLESLVADSLENLAEEGLASRTKKEISTGSQQGGGSCGSGSVPVKTTAVGESYTVVSSKSSDPSGEDNNHHNKPFKAFESPQGALHSSQQSGSMMSGSSIMSESQMGGIFAEKPPEAWVIDFNSLSMDSEIDNSSQRNKSESGGSNSNSLAFFVNMEGCKNGGEGGEGGGGASNERRGSGDSEGKKIFSMFVDVGEQQGHVISGNNGNGSGSGGGASSSSRIPSGIAQLRKPVVVNKPVVNVMETSTGSLKSLNKRFPSPIFQHKAAAEAARQAARTEWEKQKEKYYDSLEPNSILMMGGAGLGSFGGPPQLAGCGGGGRDLGKGIPTSAGAGNPMAESTVSNRSSLHVANVLESSFSSSIISSMETSQPPEMEICQGGPCFKLGKDLLRMFQEGINTDVNINVNGKWIKAHKCILASRSQYFAAILSGHWVEKAGNTINLDGFSYCVVQFTLYHIYSGTNEIPDTIDLMELATLTDLLGLEGLRENISQTFRVKFCHNFHRPCTGCITGVLECFPIAGAYGMDELHRKMTKWICKHFVRIWPTKGFASLGDELIDKCLRYSVNHLSIDNILDHTLGCDQLLSTMPTLRWTEPIFSIVNQLAAECIQFVGEHLCDVLQSQKFLQFGKGQAWNISRIEGTFLQAMDLLKPDEACLSHTALSRLVELGTLSIDEVEWSASFMDFLKALRDEVEKYLFANASKAVLSRCWEQLGQDVRKRICNTSFVGFDKFGNKIVKNTGASTGGRGSSRPSSSSNTSNTKSHGNNSTMKSKHSSNNPSTLTKIASVRPMQSQQHIVESPVTPAAAQTLPTKPNTRRERPSSASKAIKASDQLQTQASNTTVTPRNTLRSNPHKSISMDREKSFNSTNSRRTSGNSGSTASSTTSANRTPMKPLTPSVPPSKPSPLTVGYDQPSSLNNKTRPANKTSTTSSTNRNPRTQQPKPQEPPKKAFISNSAKAAAVSKPLLKPASKKTPTSSVSSLNSQQGTNDVPQTASGNRYVSRYASATTSSSLAVKSGGFSARSSFSNIERPAAVKSKVDSNPPRRNTFGQSHTGGHTTIPTKVRRPASSGNPVVRGTLKHPGVSGNTGHSSMPPVPVASTASFDFDSLNDSYSRENVMSRSTIETESGEVKMRTLAEIGRSSTFSKDEPTILGKLDMDGSGYGNIDMDYDEYE